MLLDGEDRLGAGGLVAGVRDGVLVGELGAVGVVGAGLAEGFGAAHGCWWDARWLVRCFGLGVFVVGGCGRAGCERAGCLLLWSWVCLGLVVVVYVNTSPRRKSEGTMQEMIAPSW